MLLLAIERRGPALNDTGSFHATLLYQTLPILLHCLSQLKIIYAENTESLPYRAQKDLLAMHAYMYMNWGNNVV